MSSNCNILPRVSLFAIASSIICGVTSLIPSMPTMPSVLLAAAAVGLGMVGIVACSLYNKADQSTGAKSQSLRENHSLVERVEGALFGKVNSFLQSISMKP